MLVEWQRTSGKDATMEALLKALKKIGMGHLMEKAAGIHFHCHAEKKNVANTWNRNWIKIKLFILRQRKSKKPTIKAMHANTRKSLCLNILFFWAESHYFKKDGRRTKTNKPYFQHQLFYNSTSQSLLFIERSIYQILSPTHLTFLMHTTYWDTSYYASQCLKQVSK